MDLTNHILVALPGMDDPYFKNKVIYLCEHNDEGAMGFVINSPLDISIENMLEQIEVEPAYPRTKTKNIQQNVFSGGPLAEDRGFILHRPKGAYSSSIQVSDDLVITSSKDVLTLLGTDTEPDHYIMTLGYASWKPDQLEAELTLNTWLTIPVADSQLIFDTPIHQRWHKAVEMLGIDPFQLSQQIGHA